MKPPPCKHCTTKRTIDCHDWCEEYLKWCKEERDKIRKERMKQRREDSPSHEIGVK